MTDCSTIYREQDVWGNKALLLFSTPTKFSKVLHWQRVKKRLGVPSSSFFTPMSGE